MSETSKEIASLASKVLSSIWATETEKELAGSALSQVNPDKETSKKIASLAGKVLQDPNSSLLGKELAGSCLEQYRD